MAISWVESDVGSVNRSCRVRRTLASSLLIGCVPQYDATVVNGDRRSLGADLLKGLTEAMPGIDPEDFERFRLRHEFKFLQRQFERPLFRMALDIDIKLRSGEAAVDHITFQ